MNINTQMSSLEKTQLEGQVRDFNRTLTGKVDNPQALGKDDFLKILITQLSHQDPTKPMEDKEFIAQMAQFSSLEQMNNMSNRMEELTKSLSSGRSLDLLGKGVEINRNGRVTVGRVEAVSAGADPRISVNGQYYDYSEVTKVTE